MKKLLLLTCLFLSASTISLAQENLKSREEQKQFDLQQQKALEAQEKGRKRHESIQQKKVRKRMKASAKQSRKNNERRKEVFLFRLFRRR
jgi:Ni/Co efflux regulator RcnB